MSRPPELHVLPGGDEWRIGDTTFTHGFDRGSSSDRFFIRKPASLMALYRDLAPAFQQATIVELGIAAGGSTALLALLADPRKLIACELDAAPVAALTEFLKDHRLDSAVRPFYGIDQGDRSRLAELVDAERAGAALDLVIDDASHLYEETRSSFEVLYPRLRPGGLFIIEDWAADYRYARQVEATLTGPPSAQRTKLEARIALALDGGHRPAALPTIAVELLHIAGSADGVVERIEINNHWIVVERGSAALDPDGFRLADHYVDCWHWLSPDPAP